MFLDILNVDGYANELVLYLPTVGSYNAQASYLGAGHMAFHV